MTTNVLDCEHEFINWQAFEGDRVTVLCTHCHYSKSFLEAYLPKAEADAAEEEKEANLPPFIRRVLNQLRGKRPDYDFTIERINLSDLRHEDEEEEDDESDEDDEESRGKVQQQIPVEPPKPEVKSEPTVGSHLPAAQQMELLIQLLRAHPDVPKPVIDSLDALHKINWELKTGRKSTAQAMKETIPHFRIVQEFKDSIKPRS